MKTSETSSTDAPLTSQPATVSIEDFAKLRAEVDSLKTIRVWIASLFTFIVGAGGFGIAKFWDYQNAFKTQDEKLTKLKEGSEQATRLAEDAKRNASEALSSSQQARANTVAANEWVNRTKEFADESARAAQRANEMFPKLDALKIEMLKVSEDVGAVALVNNDKLRELELVVAGQQLQFIQKAEQSKRPRILTVETAGIQLNLRFMPGKTAYDTVPVKRSHYDGPIYVPEGYTVKIVGSASHSIFFVSQELKGRVYDETTGMQNRMVEEQQR